VKTLDKLLILLILWLALGGKVPDVFTPGPSREAVIVMLHESDKGELPGYAIDAMHDLTAAGRDVRPVDDDVLNGLGATPQWLVPALEPGRKIMGPEQIDDALILLDGTRVVKAIKLPSTKEAIKEACK
jgi:hypothetical protein